MAGGRLSLFLVPYAPRARHELVDPPEILLFLWGREARRDSRQDQETSYSFNLDNSPGASYFLGLGVASCSSDLVSS